MRPLAWLATLGLSASAAWAQAPAASAPDAAAPDAPALSPAEEVQVGRRLYVSYCTRCHGVNLVTSGGAFYDLRTFPRDEKERFLRSLKEGKRAMPAWGGIIKPHEMEALWAYVGSVNGWPATAGK